MTDPTPPSSRAEWQDFLTALATAEEPLPAAAAESSLQDLQTRIGRPLPEDYRNFLLTADGFAGGELYRMHTAAETDWMRVSFGWLIEAWEDFEEEVDLLNRSLVVGSDESNAYYLLTPAGEGWTATEWWTTPSEITEYPSFGALAADLVRRDENG